MADRNDKPRPSRSLWVAIGVVLAVVIYAYGFEVTRVNLDEITSETRQQQLVRVLRDLARPDLLTYERVPTNTDASVYMPCPPGDTTNASSGEVDGRSLTVEPACTEPGGGLVVSGSGFAPNARGTLYQVPPSGDLELRLASFISDADGSFTVTVDTRERASGEAQTIRAVTEETIGSIFNRQQVWQDDNENGVRDPTAVPEDGDFSATLTATLPETWGLALVGPGRTVVDFVTPGEPFRATTGVAEGMDARAIGEREADELTISDVDGENVLITGFPGTDLTDWTLTVYDASSGISVGSSPVTDSVVMSPRISQASKDTWTRIVETVFLALLATTLGTALAVPLSFLAARNLMRDISTSMLKISLQLLAIPVGVGGGFVAAGWARQLSELMAGNLLLVVAGVVVIPVAVVAAARWAIPPVEASPPSGGTKLVRALTLGVASVGAILSLFLLANLASRFGTFVAPSLGGFSFLGTFVEKLGDILTAVIALITALIAAGVAALLAGKLAGWIRGRAARPLLIALRLPTAAAAGGVWAAMLGAGIGWLYQISDPMKTTWIPAAVGGAIGLTLALRALQRETVMVGLTIYYISRTVFNAIRSIEPLIMVIVFVVWVGLGPFAGSLALALHTLAALAKLYSEQVESILPGPIEAVKATGATRVQTIVYSVIPQIVPPYIAFTLYRWDINVRMSTIIGFAGGGGIGFLLQQNIRLLNYSAASVNMLAIAIVVASMDYLSSRIRERVI